MMYSPGLRILLAKEWSERREILGYGLVFAVLLLGYSLAYEIEYRTRALVAGYYATWSLLNCLGAVLLAMSTAAGESSQGTLKFSASLPISLRQVAGVRLFGAWACLAIPMILGAVLITLLLATGFVEQAGLRDTALDVRLLNRDSLSAGAAIAFLWTTVAINLAGSAEFLSLLCLIGTRCRTEAQVGFWGAVLFLLWFVLGSVAFIITSPTVTAPLGILFPVSLAIPWGYRDLDFASYTDLGLHPFLWGPVCGSAVLTGLIAYAFAREYGRPTAERGLISTKRRRWWRLPSYLTPGPVWFPGRIGALIWLNLRQTVPICLAGLTLALLFAVVGQFENYHQDGTFLARLAGSLPDSTWFVGILWSALVGVGSFSAELEPGLQQFWRTRPIAPKLWFWTKFLIGLIVVLVVLDGIPAAVAWKSPYHTGSGQMGFAYLLCIPLVHIEVYAISVAIVCWQRRPIASAAIALSCYMLIDTVMQSIPGHHQFDTIQVFNNLESDERADGFFSLMSHGYPVVYGLVIAITVCCAMLAHHAALHEQPKFD